MLSSTQAGPGRKVKKEQEEISRNQRTKTFSQLCNNRLGRGKIHNIPFRYGGDLAGAASRPDGLAVLGVLFAVAEEDNPKFEPMLEAAQLIKDRDITLNN